MRKRNKGFTLIELLAVIVILAIIALIAVPTVMNIINKAQKSAFKDSAYGVIKAGELYYTNMLLEPAGMSEDKTFTFPNGAVELEIKGSKPTGGSMTVNKYGKVEIAIHNGKYCVTKGFEDEDVTISEDVENCGTSNAEDIIGKPVYYNPNKAELCTETEWKNNSDKNGKSGCMRWYVYGVEDNKQKLILDHNTTATVAWNSTGENLSDYVTLRSQLETDTANWKIEADIIDALDIVKLIPYFQELDDINDWTDNYSEYVNLHDPAIQDSISKVSYDEYDSPDEYIDAGLAYFEKNHSNLALPRGLYRDLAYEFLISNQNPTVWGYWTKTLSTSNNANNGGAWGVYSYGGISSLSISSSDMFGLRPVITLSK